MQSERKLWVTELQSDGKKVTHAGLNTLTSGLILQKNSWIARGFAREYLRSCTGYEPGRSAKRHSKSSSLHLKKNVWLGIAGLLWVTL